MHIILILGQFHILEETTLGTEGGGIAELKKKHRLRGDWVAMMGNYYKLLKNQRNMTTQLKNLTTTENSVYLKKEGD